jgi:hypothetical protein
MANDFWAKKLGTPPATQQGLPPSYPPRPTQPHVPQYAQSPQVSYDPAQDQLVSRAQSSRMHDKCPGCYSGNYFAPTGTQLKRCYDCGYPIVQSGTGAGMPGGSAGGPSTPSRQVSTANNFNPTVIVDRIG